MYYQGQVPLNQRVTRFTLNYKGKSVHLRKAGLRSGIEQNAAA